MAILQDIQRASALVEAWIWDHWWLLFVGYIGVMLIMLSIRRPKFNPDAHGSARWGRRPDAQQAGLLNGDGIVLGKLHGEYLQFPGEQSVFVAGPARSGKTVTVVIPTLHYGYRKRRWSTIVLDLKGSLVDATKGYRNRYVFAPASAYSAQINYLDGIRWGQPGEITDTMQMAAHLKRMDEQTASGTGQFYIPEERLLIAAILLVVGHSPGPVTLFTAHRWFCQQAAPRALLQRLQQTSHRTVVDIATHLLSFSNDILANVFGGAAMALMPWVDPLLAHNTNITSFPWRELQTGREPMHVILRMSVDDVRARPFIPQLFFDQFLLSQTYRTVPRDYQFPLLVVLDDMAMLGRSAVIEDIPAFYGEYGLRLLAVVQSLGQLWDVMGPHASLLDNAAAQVIFQPNNPDSADYASRKLGQATMRTQQRRKTTTWGKQQEGWNAEEHPRDLLTPGEVQQLYASDVLVCVGGVPPFLAETFRWDEPLRFR